MTHHFFNSGQRKKSSESRELHVYNYNSFILEISSNWNSIRELYYRYNNHILKSVNSIEKQWLEFILKNNINIKKHGDSYSSFIEENFKKLN